MKADKKNQNVNTERPKSMEVAELIGQKDESFFCLYKEKGIVHSLFPSMHRHLFLRG
jgi:hypothetical protein